LYLHSKVVTKTFYLYVKLCFYSLVAVLFILPARADWIWQNDLATATVSPHEYAARFSFKNTGKKVVTVTKLTFSCPCIVFRFQATPAKPGETGTLAVYITRDPNEPFDHTINLIVSGSPSTKSRELTVRIEKSEPVASK
jgi:Protein of unknown function (DUF1573)